jgi:hypothetical protein
MFTVAAKHFSAPVVLGGECGKEWALDLPDSETFYNEISRTPSSLCYTLQGPGTRNN